MEFLNEFGKCFHDICIKAPADEVNSAVSKRQAFKGNMGGGIMKRVQAPAPALGGGETR